VENEPFQDKHRHINELWPAHTTAKGLFSWFAV
jgi:ribosome-associated heat shock protein Hsp15